MRELLRKARACIAQGLPIPADVSAQLESLGVDVWALETRLTETQGK